MAKTKGRPPKERKQEKFVGFFVTKVQYFVIQQKAAKAGVNISDYMRQAAVNAQVKVKWTEEERSAVRQLIGMAGEIHRIVEIAERQGATQAAVVFLSHRGGMGFIINTLCHDR